MLVASVLRPGLVALLALTALSAELSAQDAAPKAWPLGEAEVRAAVLEAAAVCQAAKGDYLAAVKPLLASGGKALPALRSLAKSGKVGRFEARVAQILAARIEHPERFEKVALYYEPARSPWDRYVRVMHDVRRKAPVRLKELSPELMDPKDREAWVRYKAGPGYKKIKGILDKYDELLALIRAGDVVAGRKLFHERAKELNRLRKEVTTWAQLYRKSRPDPAYLLAWEEAMIRPGLWEMKTEFARVVGAIGSPSSVPSLGEVLRTAVRSGVGKTKHFVDIRGYALDRLAARPSRETLVELSDTLQLARDRGKRVLLQLMIGGRLSRSPKWRALLTKLAGEPASKLGVERVRDAIRKYEQVRKR